MDFILMYGWILINIIKNCLKRVTGKSYFNYEEMNTALVDVERTLNSLPLTYLEEHVYNSLPLTIYGRNVSTENLNSDVVNDSGNAKYLRQRNIHS